MTRASGAALMGEDRIRLLAVAQGDAPADLLFPGEHVVKVFTGRIDRTEIAVAGRHIASAARRHLSSSTCGRIMLI